MILPQSGDEPSEAKAAVLSRFRQYLGVDELPLDSRLVDDLAVDSIVLVAILIDLGEDLDIDLTAIGSEVKDLHTLADVISLVESPRWCEEPMSRVGSTD
jgi:acyl carrier protein